MKKADVIKQLTDPGIIPVIRLASTEKLFLLLDALIAGGISCAELTMTIPDATNVLRSCREYCGDRLALGMGTVSEESQACGAIAAGAQFLVSPFPAFEALEKAKSSGVPFLMGAFSPWEVYLAHRAGADFVKIFPINCLPVQYLKDLKGPLPEVRFIPTGGITLNQVKPLLQAGAAAMGIGGELVSQAAIATDDWAAITRKAAEFVAAARRRKS